MNQSNKLPRKKSSVKRYHYDAMTSYCTTTSDPDPTTTMTTILTTTHFAKH